MNTYEQDWEAAIRQNVTEHRFEFDPAAWQMLEQQLASAAAPPSMPAKKAAGSWFGKGMGIMGLAVVAAGVLLYFRTDDVQPIPLPVPVPTIAAPVIPVPPAATHPSAIYKPAPRKRMVKDAPAPPLLPAATPQEGQTPPADFVAVAPLPNRPAALLERKTEEAALLRVVPTARKRNRRSLFPDVLAYPAPSAHTSGINNRNRK